MTKNELIKKAQDQLKDYSQKDIAVAVEAILSSMIDALKKDERIEIRGFGTFSIRERKARVGRNPKTGSQVSLDNRRVPFFKTGKDLKLKVDQKR